QLVRLAYNTAEPITSTPAALRAAHGAGAICDVPRRSNGTAMRATPAMINTPANSRNVTIRGECPLPEARYLAATKWRVAGQFARRPARPPESAPPESATTRRFSTIYAGGTE